MIWRQARGPVARVSLGDAPELLEAFSIPALVRFALGVHFIRLDGRVDRGVAHQVGPHGRPVLSEESRQGIRLLTEQTVGILEGPDGLPPLAGGELRLGQKHERVLHRALLVLLPRPLHFTPGCRQDARGLQGVRLENPGLEERSRGVWVALAR